MSTPLPDSPPKQEAPRDSEETFRLLVESVKDYAIFMLDPTGHIMTWNAGAERIKGYTASDVIGKHFSIFYTPQDIARSWPQHELEVAAREGRYEEEGIRVRKDGSRFYALVVITAVYDAAGRLRGFAKVTRDITERKHAEEALRASEEQLRRAHHELERRVEERTQQLAETNQELESFCYTVSHDLRAPLRGMQGFASALAEDYAEHLDETAQDYLLRITRASKRMEALIQDLLDYSRLSREHIALQPVSLQEVAEAALAQVAGEVERHDASVELEPTLPRVIGNRSVLVRVLANLLTNAVKFTESDRKPRVRVYSTPHDGSARLWVADNGIGIKPEHHERVFRVFERLHGVEQYSGTGIGLAIVRKGLERMGGRAGVESELGAGSRFWIELPAAGASST